MQEKLTTTMLSSFASNLLPVLLDASIKGALILTLAGLATLAMRRVSAATRHLVWLLAIVSLAALPVISVILPGWHVLPSWLAMIPQTVPADVSAASTVIVMPEPPPQPFTIDLTSLESAASSVAIKTDPAKPDHPAASSGATTESRTTVIGEPNRWSLAALWVWIVPVWTVGAFAALMPVFIGMLSLWCLSRTSHRITDECWMNPLKQVSAELGLKRSVTLLLSDCRSMPMAWGLFKSKLLLPKEASDWSIEQRRMVLLHELAHIKRWDCLTHVIARFACALHWFNPLAWVTARRLFAESEKACDDLALNSGWEASDYAERLLQAASGLQAPIVTGYTSISMARLSRLEGRLRAILDTERNRRALTRLVVIVALMVAVSALLPLAAIRPAARAEDAPHKSDPRVQDAGDTQHNETDKNIRYLLERDPTRSDTLFVPLRGSSTGRSEHSLLRRTLKGKTVQWEYFLFGETLSRIVSDENRDGKPDRWRFFYNGWETCREEDQDYDGKVDDWRWFAGDGKESRWGKDTSGDGILDSWLILDQEGACRELFRAMLAGDPSALEALYVAPEDKDVLVPFLLRAPKDIKRKLKRYKEWVVAGFDEVSKRLRKFKNVRWKGMQYSGSPVPLVRPETKPKGNSSLGSPPCLAPVEP